MASSVPVVDPKRHYTLIYDPTAVCRFLSLFASSLQPGEVFLVYLCARRKYNMNLLCDKGTTVFQRKLIAETDVKYQLRELLRYETPVGTYTTARTDEPITADALALYWLLNPRSATAGYFELLQKMNKLQLDLAQGRPSNLDFSRVQSYYKSCVHKKRATKRWLELDVDTKDPAILQEINRVILPAYHKDKAYVCTIETHGGFHVIYETAGVRQWLAQWHKTFTHDPRFQYQEASRGKAKTMLHKRYVDIRMDPSPPIPGTLQGGFRVRFVTPIGGPLMV